MLRACVRRSVPSGPVGSGRVGSSSFVPSGDAIVGRFHWVRLTDGCTEGAAGVNDGVREETDIPVARPPAARPARRHARGSMLRSFVHSIDSFV